MACQPRVALSAPSAATRAGCCNASTTRGRCRCRGSPLRRRSVDQACHPAPRRLAPRRLDPAELVAQHNPPLHDRRHRAFSEECLARTGGLGCNVHAPDPIVDAGAQQHPGLDSVAACGFGNGSCLRSKANGSQAQLRSRGSRPAITTRPEPSTRQPRHGANVPPPARRLPGAGPGARGFLHRASEKARPGTS